MQYVRETLLFCGAFFALLLSFPALFAQELDVEEHGLPELRNLAASLSDPDSRMDTLMSMVAMTHLLEMAPVYSVLEEGELESGFRSDRAWLDRLAARFTHVPIRSNVLDSSAWLITLELDQHQLSPQELVSPTGPDTNDLVFQVFDRADEGLAATALPELLMRMEYLAPVIWQGVLERVAIDPDFLVQMDQLNAEWFDPWTAAEPPAPVGEEAAGDPMAQAIEAFEVLADSTMTDGAPDSLGLKRLRFNLLVAIPALEPQQARDAAYILRLASALDGLQDGNTLAFTEALLWVVSDLLLESQKAVRQVRPVTPPDPFRSVDVAAEIIPVEGESENSVSTEPETEQSEDSELVKDPDAEAEALTAEASLPASLLPRTLSALLPRLSNVFAREFSTVDPRLNANLAAAFDVAQSLQDGLPPDLARQTVLIRELADAVAQFALQLPDLSYYADQPVRAEINQKIDRCVGLAVTTPDNGGESMSREQFDECVVSMVELADDGARSAELAGDPDGPYGALQLQRELELMPWQRINYILGFLHERAPDACLLPDRPLVNALEWSTLATTLTWFARQTPVYFQTPENEAVVLSMKQQGSELLQMLKQQVTCFSNNGPGINDPVQMSLSVYREALDELIAGIREAELTFRESNLAPGADIVLQGGSGQRTAYRPDGLEIGPCNQDSVCEMTGTLEATRALIGLFPDQYLVADQSGLGKVEICYDNVQWVQRRTELVRPDDPNVANFYGRLSFDLIGRFREGESTREIFGSNFVSPEDYHYLFAANNDEVLDDSCPVEWVGTKTVTKLNHDSGIRVVPDRLTYLAGAREQPSQVINQNWGRGAEWRDWFVTGLGITQFEFAVDETILDRLDQHLQTLYQAEQSALYRALLRPPSRGGVNDAMSLFEEMSAVTTAKDLVRSQISLFYPDYLVDSDTVRRYLQGTQSLVDESVLARFQESNVGVGSINDIGMLRFDAFQSFWDRQPEMVRSSGSPSIPVARAVGRLNALYREFFREQDARGGLPSVRGPDG